MLGVSIHRQTNVCLGLWLHALMVTLYTAISREVVGKTVHTTIPKGNMGYDQHTFPDIVAVENTVVAFLQYSQTYVQGLSCHPFKFR